MVNWEREEGCLMRVHRLFAAVLLMGGVACVHDCKHLCQEPCCNPPPVLAPAPQRVSGYPGCDCNSQGSGLPHGALRPVPANPTNPLPPNFPDRLPPAPGSPLPNGTPPGRPEAQLGPPEG